MASGLSRSAAAAALLIAGLVCLALWRIVSGTEAKPFVAGAQPPQYVTVTSGKTYSLAVPGGVPALLAAGVPLSGGGTNTTTTSPDLECDWRSAGLPPQPLQTTAESSDTKATEVVGSFVAPVTGRIHVACRHWGTVFVPDADNASGDPSGWFLLASIVLLLLGGGAGLSVGWAYSSGRSAASPQDDQEETRGDAELLAVEDAETGA